MKKTAESAFTLAAVLGIWAGTQEGNSQLGLGILSTIWAITGMVRAIRDFSR